MIYTGDPQALYPDVLPQYIKEMKELGWDRGQDDEELFEFAMHDKQYREFKSGQAKEQFNKDLAERMQKAGKPVPEELQQYLPKAEPVTANPSPVTAATDDEMAAIAMALHKARRPGPNPAAATLPIIHTTQWKRFNP